MHVRAVAIAALLLVLPTMTSHAAVRKCGAAVSSDIVTAETERDGKKQALDRWRAAAQKFGEGFDSWRLAADKVLKCSPVAGGFDCIAYGAPCIIDQTPRSPPKGKGTGI